MTATAETVAIKLERTIPASPGKVFDAWLDPSVPGTPWHGNEKLIVDPRVDGLWYWLSLGSTPHYGRFLDMERPGLIRISWMSPNTLGLESTVTVTFEQNGEGTLLTLVHSGLPNDEMARAHEKGWGAITERFSDIFAGGTRRSA
jgi:uncharacterized protein YndB with AHSA1/START domain